MSAQERFSEVEMIAAAIVLSGGELEETVAKWARDVALIWNYELNFNA
jgi:hypothetical protein